MHIRHASPIGSGSSNTRGLLIRTFTVGDSLSARGDPLEAIDRHRLDLGAKALPRHTPNELKKSSAGRKPFDAILMFRMLVLQALNNLSDEQVEYQVRDRLSFSRFLGLAIEDSIQAATTL